MTQQSLELDIGEQIRLLRQRRAYTQRQLAARAGVSPRTLSRIEKGEGSPRYENILRIIDALDGVIKIEASRTRKAT